ncbi:hypothetical protein, partial [Acinetobacter baumannii]|uniref:hypothetical protein n=1 Tax=Acinetobacter baumannii TaxID=470 RepID=UPI003393F258
MANKAAIPVSSAGSVKGASGSGTLASRIFSISLAESQPHLEGSTSPPEGLARLASTTQKLPSTDEPQK